MQIDIYVREKNGKRELRMPLLPEEIQFQSGDATVVSYEIMGLGEVAIPSGTELGTWSWKGKFPGRYRENDPMIRGTWYTPEDYDRTLNDWKKNGTELNLIVTGYPINVDVYISKYHGAASGAFGDISYEVEFFESRKIVVTTTKVKQPAPEPKRPATTSTTYVIKSGDTLWSIAKKFYGSGSKWGTIYNANKDIIEKTAKKRGMKSSDNGHWIFSGTVLTIPNTATNVSVPYSTPTTTTTTGKPGVVNYPTPTPWVEKYKNDYTTKRTESLTTSLQRYGNAKVQNALNADRLTT